MKVQWRVIGLAIVALVPAGPGAFAHRGTRQAPGAPGARAAPTTPRYFYRGAEARAGYGFLASSEAEAGDAFNFSCSPSSRASYVRQACGYESGLPTGTTLESIKEIANALSRREAEAGLRRKILEHMALQAWALSGGRPMRIPQETATCMGDAGRSSPEFRLIDRLPRLGLSGTDPGLGEGSVPTAGQAQAVRAAVGDEGADRTTAVASQLSQESLLSAVIMAGFYNRALQREGCAITTRMIGAQSQRCRSIHRSLFRLRTAYPSVFGPDPINPTMSPEAVRVFGQLAPALSSDATAQGQLAGLTQVSAGTDPTDPRGPSTLTASAVAALRTPAGRQLRESLIVLRTNYVSQLFRDMSNLCGLGLDRLVMRDPTATRQLLVDASRTPDRTDRAMYRLALCGSESYTGVLHAQACGNVYDSSHVPVPNEPAAQWVSGTNEADYPFAGEVNYGLQSLAGGRRRVKMTLNLIVPPGGTPPDAATIQDWQRRTTEFYNSEAARLHQNVEFAFRFATGAAPADHAVNITYHACWCSTCSATLPAPNNVPPERDACGVAGRMMQADSGNWHPGVDLMTVQHEVGHALGLADEYDADYYPFNSLGEPNSIMREATAPPRLYWRHFQQILHPNRCD